MSQADPLPWDRIKGILAGALERAAADRPAFLATACGDDARLRQEVESLLAAHAAAEASQFIETPPEFRDPAGLEGHVVGPYKVLGEIGRGGMGAVYRAVRADDVYQKQVALKVVGRLDPDLIQRFREERQILAGLDHPGIARLIDGGATADGLPWLAMDLVEGQPITEYVQAHALSLRQRLELFRETCAAVHYAHQNLVVHRDLKPSNILVTPAGAPRLLDCGIAKLLSAEGRTTIATLTSVRPMTPEYASPEQALGQPITTASDIYSLGVLLCEMLTGRLPHEFATREPIEVARVIATVPPIAPSALAGNGLRAIPSRQLQGDLDNIVSMALRKEPERRYASVDQLSGDVRRHLERLPVIARPDTMRYRAGKFVRRNRGLVATAAVLSLSLVVALAVAIGEAREARRERAKAEQRFEDVHQL
ncbi:MAG TPA: serine/threonine-protein kinase, partial [Vicinamibacteria bacterium]|nr:serine/threonine-protein kinase [Vicinamibacteria bacterium]